MKKILLLILIFVSCKTQEEVFSEQEETYILIDGKHIEMVADEFGNQYLKQHTYLNTIYIPFPFETESAKDSLNSLHAKIPTYDK
jgi:hypothetical protein